MLSSIRISVLTLMLSACSVTHSEKHDELCLPFVESALNSIDACLTVMQDSLTRQLPDDADTAGVDVFQEGFEIGISHGRLMREGGDKKDLRVYLVCAVDVNGEVESGHFYTYGHWPPEGAIPDLHISDGRYIERFYGPAHYQSYSQSELRPQATLLFNRADEKFTFSECIKVPDDW